MKNKVVFVVHSYDFQTRGGVLKVVSMLSNEFVKSGEVEILSFGQVKQLPYPLDENVKISSLNQKKYDTRFYKGVAKVFWFLKAFFLLIKFIRKNSKAYFLTTSPPLNLVFGVLRLFKKNITVFGCDHTSVGYKSAGIGGKIKFYLYQRLNAIIALTQDDCDIYIQKRINAFYIPNPLEKVVETTTHSLHNRLLYVGRFSAEKRPDLALKSYYLSKLWKEGIHFYMYGYGEMHQYLNSLIQEYSLSDYVHIISNESDPSKIYKDAFALVLTSKVEGFGMVLLEAISRGIPCISTNAPFGPKNIIINGQNGYLVEDNQIDEYLDVNKINVLRDNDIPLTVNKFQTDNVMKLWLRLFKSLEIK